jgi:hypothetical protein
MKIATVLDSSDPVSMMRRHRGMISVDKRKWITVLLSFCCIMWLKVKNEGRSRATHFDKSPNNPEGSQAKIFKRACFRGCVEKGIQEEGYMGWSQQD